MKQVILLLTCWMLVPPLWSQSAQPPSLPSFNYEIASQHEIKPHRREIPLKGVGEGFNQLHIILTVSASGDVLSAEATGEANSLKFWPDLEDEVRQWKFAPFEMNGQPVTASIDEYLELVPPERLPKVHVPPPSIRPDSKVSIELSRSGCFGTCPAYHLTVSTEGIAFEGESFVAAPGKHTAAINADDVRKLAARFVAADFYSMDASYNAHVTDNPTYTLAISINGHRKEIEDYVGSWVGIPQVISELENATDELAESKRWIKGSNGLVDALHAEAYDFRTVQAQETLKEVASRGEAATVRQLLDVGVLLSSLPPSKSARDKYPFRTEGDGWLTAAARQPEALQALIFAEASKDDQNDKDKALRDAADSGQVDAVRALLAYGANPNADLTKLSVTESIANMTFVTNGEATVLYYAARSGNAAVVREILRYHPDLEARDARGRTVMFAVGEHFYGKQDDTRAECVRLLAEAGADVNARDKHGNTPLHEATLHDVKEALLKMGADVNARNDDGDTPIFTTFDPSDYSLFVRYGADLTVTNDRGDTVFQLLEKTGPKRLAALREAIEKSGQH